MANRYTETDKYKDAWFIDLSPESKLLFYFLIDNVNNAGFWEESIKTITFFLGLDKKQYSEAKEGLSRGLLISDKGNVLYLKNFLKHQGNLPLNKYNNCHKRIFSELQKGIKDFSQNIAFFYELPCCHIKRENKKIVEEIEENFFSYLGPNEPLITSNKGLFRPPCNGNGNSNKEKGMQGEKQNPDIEKQIITASGRIYKLHPRVLYPTFAERAVYDAIMLEIENGLTAAEAIKLIENGTRAYAEKHGENNPDGNQYAKEAKDWFAGGGYKSAELDESLKTPPEPEQAFKLNGNESLEAWEYEQEVLAAKEGREPRQKLTQYEAYEIYVNHILPQQGAAQNA